MLKLYSYLALAVDTILWFRRRNSKHVSSFGKTTPSVEKSRGLSRQPLSRKSASRKYKGFSLFSVIVLLLSVSVILTLVVSLLIPLVRVGIQRLEVLSHSIEKFESKSEIVTSPKDSISDDRNEEP